MQSFRPWRALALAVGVFSGGVSAFAGDLPPAGGKPLSAILQSVEAQNAGIITDAEFDRGHWEIKVCQATACEKRYVDPRSGTQTRSRPTDYDDDTPTAAYGSKLSAAVAAAEASGTGRVTEVQFDHGLWKIELRHNGRKVKRYVNPTTGAVVNQ